MNNSCQKYNINPDDIIIITDNDGNKHDCVILDIVEYKNKNYAALIPANIVDAFDEEDTENTDATNLFIMEIETDDKGDFLKSIEDQDNYEEICQLMIDRLSDNFDIEK